MDATCDTCRWFGDVYEVPHGGREGTCYFHPPIVVQIGDSFGSQRPYTDANERCSQWVSDES